MRFILTLLLTVGALLLPEDGAAAEPQESVDLILVAGQSNAVGYDAKPSELPADAADQQILFWWRCGDPPPDDHDSSSGGKWSHLQAQPLGDPKTPRQNRQYGNFAQAEGGFGPEMGLGRTLYAKQKKRLAIVKAAFSGTNLQRDWNHTDPEDSDSCYRALVSETKAAIAAADKQGIHLRPRALAWVQGESDANQNDAEHYAAHLGQMLAALRKDLNAPDLIALVAVNTRFGNGKNPHMPIIVEQQKQLAEKDPRCHYVDTSAATIANGAHFDSAGTLLVGRLFAEALLHLENSTSASVSSKIKPKVECEGIYPHHLQGICIDDNEDIYWSFTTTLVKTNATGKVLKQIPVANHHGDLCYDQGKIYVAVNLGRFNDPQGNADSWVYVYRADDLSLVSKHAAPEVFFGAGGIGVRDGQFYVVGGLPDGVKENYIYQYDADFKFIKKHVLASGHTHLGIQTASFSGGRWWFGCYGDPKILLVAGENFQMHGRYEFDCSLGIVGLGDGELLSASGHCDKAKGCVGTARIMVADETSGLRIYEP